MKQLICEDCKNTFGEDELATWEEARGEFWGQPCYETMQGCPYCHSCAVIEIVEESEDSDDDSGTN